MKETVYIFSGLGADERVFQNLDFSSYNSIFVKWIEPNCNESIESYSTRILKQITTTKPVLIGLSFGGIIAIEIAKLIETEKIVLISSAKNQSEIPYYYRFAGKLMLHKIIPSRLLRISNLFTNWFFGVNSTNEKHLLKQILKDTDPIFLKWAILNILCWKNNEVLNNVIHIHGASDRILPIRFVNASFIIRHAGHFMVLNKAKEVQEIINQNIK